MFNEQPQGTTVDMGVEAGGDGMDVSGPEARARDDRVARARAGVRRAKAGGLSSRRSSAHWATASGAPAESIAVDVLVPTCDRPAELGVTLAGLAAQEDPAFHVVVSDQSHSEPSWKHPAVGAIIRVLQAQSRRVTLLRHVPRLGMAEHRQYLLDQSQANKILFLDDDVWLEPGALERMSGALDQLGCGFVGMAPQGLSHLDDRRPDQIRVFEAWVGPVRPESVRPNSPQFDRWPLHSAANLSHLSADLGLGADEWIPYPVAWLGGCTMYRRQALDAAGGFNFWRVLPPEHCGEDVLAQWRVMEKFGGAGILPAGAVHLESPTTIPNRRVEAYEQILESDL